MKIPLGMSLPHRSPDGVDMAAVRDVAQRADTLGFRELWVTANTLDPVFSFDPLLILTHAASVTTRIRVGVSVLVLPVYSPLVVAHQVATLDVISNGRAILGVGLGREAHYKEFGVPTEHRVRRFREEIELIKTAWTEPKIDYSGTLFQVHGASMALKPVQKPHPPIWLGGDHPDAVRRAATLADAWMGSGGSSAETFKKSVPILKEALEKAGRDPAKFPISKRVFLSVHERPDVARTELDRWFTTVYRNPNGADASGVHGTPEQVKQRLEDLIGAGANHLLLNPVGRYVEQVDMLAKIAGL